MSSEALSEEKVAHCIQLCLSEEEVPDEELQSLNELMKSNSSKAKEIAVRILDENMIRSWFRSEADTVFINEVQKRLKLRFQDSEFISAVMSKVHEGLEDVTSGEAGQSVVKDEVKSVSMLKYILVPVIAFIAYAGLFHSDFIKAFFANEDSFLMTVDDLRGKPTVLNDDKRKTALMKMIIHPGDTLNTGNDQELKLKYPDYSTIEVKDNSSALIVKSKTKKEIQLLRGSLKVSAVKQNAKTPMTIHTSFALIKITEGMAGIALSDTSDFIEVLSGSVLIEHASANISKSAGPGQKFAVSSEGVTEIDLTKIKEETRELSNE